MWSGHHAYTNLQALGLVQTVMGVNRMLDEVNGNGRHCYGLNDVG